ncbi:hypothetical protein AGR3A_Lc160064 [Agrobacterium tomkonis CFBP 6623]|uniref:Uncharacterized protein n=1 Tax=Agrobacterium tomkonis CFBP 6623 TaxID=1183432 RepID=A0A1S7RY98_9HYPH|nr:hypothetical protein AGR3A_Lc160064 [Agrobacterium tomkonis CFBP 6623]
MEGQKGVGQAPASGVARKKANVKEERMVAHAASKAQWASDEAGRRGYCDLAPALKATTSVPARCPASAPESMLRMKLYSPPLFYKKANKTRQSCPEC